MLDVRRKTDVSVNFKLLCGEFFSAICLRNTIRDSGVDIAAVFVLVRQSIANCEAINIEQIYQHGGWRGERDFCIDIFFSEAVCGNDECDGERATDAD